MKITLVSIVYCLLGIMACLSCCKDSTEPTSNLSKQNEIQRLNCSIDGVFYKYIGSNKDESLNFIEVKELSNNKNSETKVQSLVLPLTKQIEYYRTIRGLNINEKKILTDSELIYGDAEMVFFQADISLVDSLLKKPDLTINNLYIYEIPNSLWNRISSGNSPVFLALKIESNKVVKVYKFTIEKANN